MVVYPLVLRIVVTGTFKHQKVELRNQGCNPNTVKDPLYIFNPAKKAYRPMTHADYNALVTGKSRL